MARNDEICSWDSPATGLGGEGLKNFYSASRARGSQGVPCVRLRVTAIRQLPWRRGGLSQNRSACVLGSCRWPEPYVIGNPNRLIVNLGVGLSARASFANLPVKPAVSPGPSLPRGEWARSGQERSIPSVNESEEEEGDASIGAPPPLAARGDRPLFSGSPADGCLDRQTQWEYVWLKRDALRSTPFAGPRCWRVSSS